jgi:alpha-L-rhamnosidase
LSRIPNHNQRGEKQSAYQVLVASRLDLLRQDQGDEWDSGEVASEDSTQVIYQGQPIESEHTYYWEGPLLGPRKQHSDYSAAATFETGLLSREEWKGQWIAGNELRKELRLAGKVVRVRLYVTALGYYEVRLNGEKVGENVLDPERSERVPPSAHRSSYC